MARPSPIDDPETRAFVIENLAKGQKQSLIAQALEVNENTVTNWKKNKVFKRELAAKKLEILGAPMDALRKSNPLAFLERHPDTREDFAPPAQKKQIEADVTVSVKKYSIADLKAAMKGED